MKRTLVIFLSTIFIFSCESNRVKTFDKVLNSIEETWQTSTIEEISLPHMPQPTDTISFPKSFKILFHDCDYKDSGNNCYASIQISSTPEFEIKYNIATSGTGENVIAFIYPSNVKLSASDSLFVKGSWTLKRQDSNRIEIEQRSVQPYYKAVLIR